MKVQNVLYVPDLMKSPTKVTRLYSHRGGHDVTYGYPTFVYTKDSSWLEFDNFKVMLDSNSNRNLFTMKTSIVHPNDDISLFAATSRPTSRELLHRRLGHISEGGMERLSRYLNGAAMR